MLPIFWPTLLALLAIISLAIGLPGVVRGGQVARERGRDTLMHYPGPSVWLKGRLTAARWVQWIGRLYLVTAVCLATLAFSLGLGSTTLPNPHACERLATTILDLPWAEQNWRNLSNGERQHGCNSLIMDAEGTRWFSIHSSGSDGLIGEGYRHQVRELERSGMAIKPISDLGRRAVIATSRAKGLRNPILVIEHDQGIHRIEMNGLTLDTDHRRQLIDAIRKTIASAPAQAM